MSWNNFLGEREALTYGSEMFKQTVVKYYQLQEYRLSTSSSQESHLPDLIMSKDNEKTLWIEAKSSKVSIFEKRFKQEILSYFTQWLRLPESQRTKFVIFSEDLARQEDTKEIMTYNAKEDTTIEWFEDRDNLKLNEETEALLKTSWIKV